MKADNRLNLPDDAASDRHSDGSVFIAKDDSRPDARGEAEVLSRFGGPAETIAASLPKELVDAIRSLVGKREFSRFVGQALAREIIDRERGAYVRGMELIHGPVDSALVAELESVFDR